MDHDLIFVAVIIFAALAFDYTNGFHDAANSIATIVSTRVLTPKQAVIWAAFFNFAAFFLFKHEVAKTVGVGMIDIHFIDNTVIFAGLLGTIAWNLTTWYLGLPTSSSHALIGGYAGAAIAKAGIQVIIAKGWTKTILFIVLAPTMGMILGLIFISLTTWLVYKNPPSQINKWFRGLQLVSAALYSLGHGGNDAQKTMGIITGVIIIYMKSKGQISADFDPKSFDIPVWVAISAYAAISLGTLSGGWKIVETMGQKITKLRPIEGFCAETASAVSIFFATHLGVPVSTTHVITGAISGVGAAKRLSAVRWGVTLRIVWAWFLTIPLAGIFAFASYKIMLLVSPFLHP
ncbi:MAG: inorganic phosphate transporter [Firmicutes bacterium]|nr:inorganic phosphate transporter [Bacillota bacterium]